MERLSHKLTDYILKRGMIDEESYEIYQYGMLCFLEISFSTLCCILIALCLHMLTESLFFLLIFIPVRSFGGGLHLKTYLACFIGSCLMLASVLLAVKFLTVPVAVSFVLHAVATVLLLFIGPVDHPNKEISPRENKVFKKRTYIALILSFAISIVLLIAQNERYMFLQALTMILVVITSLIGRKVNKWT